MSKRIRECGPIKQTGLGVSSLREKTDWTRANIADGTWTLNDPDTTLSGITNIGGINQVVIGTDNNDDIIDGGVHYKQVLNADGSPLDFTDKPVMIEFYIHWPHCGWAVGTDGSHASGGLGRPTTASKCYTVAGIMTDPENLPATAGASEFPTDILGFGIEMRNNVQKQRYLRIRNNGTGAPRGALETSSSDLGSAPSSGDYDSDGRKTNANRVSWFAHLAKNDGASGTGINVVGEPMVDEVSWEKYYDDGDKWTTPVEWIVSQRFGRVRTDKLYVWISSGRGQSGAGSSVTVDFDVYYRIVALDSGVSPSGRTGLAS